MRRPKKCELEIFSKGIDNENEKETKNEEKSSKTCSTTVLHMKAFTHRPLLHTAPFTHSPFYTQPLSHTNTLEKKRFDIQKKLHIALTYKALLHTNPLYTQTHLHADPFTHTHIYIYAHTHLDIYTHIYICI